MKRAIIAHCWDGTPNYCWYPYVQKELEANGFEVTIPQLPETGAPKLSLWLPKLEEVIGTPTDDLILIGHSAGSVTILRYLEKLPEGVQIGGAILVAGFTDPLGYSELENFFQTPLDLASVKNKAKQFVLVHSDNDPFVPLSHGHILETELGAKLIVKQQAGHFSQEDRCTKLPVVVEEAIRLSN